MAESILSVTQALAQFVEGVKHGSTVPKLRNLIASVPFLDGSNDHLNGQVFYVGKHGSDQRSGRQPYSAFQSIGAAITAAQALTPAVDNRVTIWVLDGGDYAESLSLPEWVDLIGPAAKLVGTGATATPLLTQASNTLVHVAELAPQHGQGGALAANTAGIKRLQARKVAASGSGGYGAINSGGAGGVLYYRVDETRVGESAFGLGDISVASGHTHLQDCGDFYLEGIGATAIARIGDGSTVGVVSHVLETGDGVGQATAFNAGGGTIAMFCCQVSAATPKDGAGAVNVTLPDGTQL